MANNKQLKKYDIEFENKAVNELENLADYYSISKSNLKEVILKGIKILEIAKDLDTSTVYLRTSPTSIKTVDIKDI